MGEGRRVWGVGCSPFAAGESAVASGKVQLCLQVCAAHAGDDEAKAGVGDEAEQDTNDQGERPSKFLPNGSQPDGERFFALTLLGTLGFSPLRERAEPPEKLRAQKHGTVGLPSRAAAEIFCLPLRAQAGG